jgi:hypothetical protein
MTRKSTNPGYSSNCPPGNRLQRPRGLRGCWSSSHGPCRRLSQDEIAEIEARLRAEGALAPLSMGEPGRRTHGAFANSHVKATQDTDASAETSFRTRGWVRTPPLPALSKSENQMPKVKRQMSKVRRRMTKTRPTDSNDAYDLELCTLSERRDMIGNTYLVGYFGSIIITVSPTNNIHFEDELEWVVRARKAPECPF